MPESSELACRIANKVALHMRYLVTTSDRTAAKAMAEEALLLTLQLLGQIDAPSFCEQYQQQHHTYTQLADRFINNPAEWSSAMAQQCEVLRSEGIQEKLIAELGDELDGWDFQAVSLATVEDSLNRLAEACSTNAAAVGDRMLDEDESTAKTDSSTAALWKAVSGVMIILTSSNSNTGHADHLAAFANFGGALLTSSVSKLK